MEQTGNTTGKGFRYKKIAIHFPLPFSSLPLISRVSYPFFAKAINKHSRFVFFNVYFLCFTFTLHLI